MPSPAALFIIDTLATWNELLVPLVLASAKDSRTVPLGSLQLQGEHSSQHTLIMAGVLISTIPVLLILPPALLRRRPGGRRGQGRSPPPEILMTGPKSLPKRTVGEWSFTSGRT